MYPPIIDPALLALKKRPVELPPLPPPKLVPQVSTGVPAAGMAPPSPRLGPSPVTLPEAAPAPALRPMLPPLSAPPVAAPDRPAPQLSREGVALPALPGDSGPKPYSPIEAARYDAGMQRAKRDPSGNLTGGFKRSFKDTALNTLYGFAQGAQQGGFFGGLGGAAAGGIGTALNPAGGAQYRFDVEQLPRMQADEARTQAAIKQARDQDVARLGTEKTRAEIDRINADIANQTAVQEANRRKEAQEAGKLIPVAPGTTMLDPRTRQPAYSAPQLPQRAVPLTAGGSLVDPVTGRTVASVPALPEKPVSLAPGASLVNPTTGETVASSPERSATGRIPQEANFKAEDVAKEKTAAEDLWATAKQLPDGPEKNQAVVAAQKAQADYNAKVKELGSVYGSYFETGLGEGGWAYLKPKERQERQAPQGRGATSGGGAAGPTRKLSDLKSLLK